MTPETVLTTSSIVGVVCAALVLGESIRLVWRSFERKYKFTEHATRLSKARLAADYVARNLGWRYAPKKLGGAFIAGFAFALVLQLAVVGFFSTFL